MYEYEITLSRVVDGDTIDAFIDLGFKTHVVKRIRFYGINAPESRTRDKQEKIRGLAAKERVEQLLNNADSIILQSHGVGKFGRVLGSLTVVNGKTKKDVVATLLEEGHGTEYFGGKR